MHINAQPFTARDFQPLREAILKHLEQLDGLPAASLSLSANDIIITTGSQQSLYIIGDVLLNPGDIVIAESPSYFVYTGALASSPLSSLSLSRLNRPDRVMSMGRLTTTPSAPSALCSQM